MTIPQQESFKQEEIFYKAYERRPAIANLIIVLVFAIVFCWGVFFSTDEITTNRWIVFLIIAVFVLTFVIMIREMLVGVRSMTIRGNQLEIIYPKEKFTASHEELSDIMVFRRSSKRKGALKGTVFFKDVAGKKDPSP